MINPAMCWKMLVFLCGVLSCVVVDLVASAELTRRGAVHVSTSSTLCPYIDPARPGAQDLKCDDGFLWLLPRSCTPIFEYNLHILHEIPTDCVYRDRVNDFESWPVLDPKSRRAAPVLLDIGSYNHDGPQPLVSALHPFVSTDDSFLKARRKFITSSIAQWNAQRYGNLEYVIVYHVDDTVTAAIVRDIATKVDGPTRRIKHVTVSNASMALGEVRNVAIEAATGVYVVTWDDDNVIHPLRIASQVLALQCSGKKAVMLDSTIEHWTENTGNRTFLSNRNQKIQTVLAERALMKNCYANNKRRGEDTGCSRFLTSASPRVVVLIHAPWLYVYVKHGDNISPDSWFSRHPGSSARSSGANVSISTAVHRRLTSFIENLSINPWDGLDLSSWPSTREIERTRCNVDSTQDEQDRFWNESHPYFSP